MMGTGLHELAPFVLSLSKGGRLSAGRSYFDKLRMSGLGRAQQ